jgi:hypothetical protein
LSLASSTELDFLAPVGHGRLSRIAWCKPVQKQLNCQIGEFLGTDAALEIIPCIGEVDDSEQDHRIDLLGALDDLALRVKPDQQIGNDIDQLPFQILDGLLFVLIKKRQIVNQRTLLI